MEMKNKEIWKRRNDRELPCCHLVLVSAPDPFRERRDHVARDLCVRGMDPERVEAETNLVQCLTIIYLLVSCHSVR